MRFFAHRGSSCLFAEHTRAAYAQAIVDGADGLECDVQFTADKQLVLWHDATVDRTSSGSGLLQGFALAELRALDVFSWRQPDIPAGFGSPAEQLLTLPNLLDLAVASERPLRVLIEFKHPSPFGHELEDAVLALLREQGWDPASGTVENLRIQFMSFASSSSEYLFGKVPARDLMFLFDSVSKTERGKTLVDDGKIGGVGPSLQFARAHPEQIRTWVDAGRTVRVWTVNTPDDVAFCHSLGVSEVTSDLPGRLPSA